MNEIIAFDIETVANKTLLERPGIIPEFEGKAGTKDPVKIKAQIEEKGRKFIANAALSPNYGKIVCISLRNDDTSVSFSGDDEPAIIRDTWGALKDCRELVGYNSKLFDLVFLLRRSWFLGIRPTSQYDLFPYRTVNHYDLRLILSHGDKTAAGKLSTYIKLKFGEDIEGKGSEVAELWAAGKIAEIVKHCESDVGFTWRLFKSMQGFYI